MQNLLKIKKPAAIAGLGLGIASAAGRVGLARQAASCSRSGSGSTRLMPSSLAAERAAEAACDDRGAAAFASERAQRGDAVLVHVIKIS
jgi:hypothetical protein